MWADECECYRIDSFGFCEAPCKNDGVLEHRILKVKDWIPHWKEMGVRAVLFSPLMESDTNGYDTKDHRKLDVRLGTNADWKEVCDELHKNDIRVVLEGVFQYVGRGFGPFHDLLSYRECSPYVKWFHTIDFYGNSVYEDCLWYEGRNGNYDLVKLNLYNEEVIRYLFESVRFWVEEFGIDGLQLDEENGLPGDFVRRLRDLTGALKEDFLITIS